MLSVTYRSVMLTCVWLMSRDKHKLALLLRNTSCFKSKGRPNCALQFCSHFTHWINLTSCLRTKVHEQGTDLLPAAAWHTVHSIYTGQPDQLLQGNLNPAAPVFLLLHFFTPDLSKVWTPCNSWPNLHYCRFYDSSGINCSASSTIAT